MKLVLRNMTIGYALYADQERAVIKNITMGLNVSGHKVVSVVARRPTGIQCAEKSGDYVGLSKSFPNTIIRFKE